MEEIRIRNRLLSIKRELYENKSNRFATDLRVLDSFKVTGQGACYGAQHVFDFILPTGSALRNYLAHGDIYLDLFSTQKDGHNP